MSQQAVNLVKNTLDLLQDNWTLEDQLSKKEITWFPFEPTRKEIREKPLVITGVFLSGTGDPSSKAVYQMTDVLRLDVYISMRNLEGEDTREKSEDNRMLLKDEIIRIIHDNQTAISGVKFGRYQRSARQDEVDSSDEQWYLHEILYIQAEWFQVES